MHISVCRGQKMASDCPELELQVVTSYLNWVLRAKLQFSLGAARALKF